MRNKILSFIQLESFSGILLFFAAAAGLILANSHFASLYQHILHEKKFSLMINDGLMVLFFLLAGCEIKREVLSGELNSRRKIFLPLAAALLGMVIPAGFYIAFNFQYHHLLRGWAIPSATDIAFALGVLSLLGKRIPLSLKALLTAIAIFDDVGAIVIIAFFYTQTLHWIFLSLGLFIFMLLNIMNYFSVQKLSIYFILGIILWFCILKSGIHPTIAGVLLAFTIPHDKIPVLEKFLHPWVAYIILPVFAIANTGIILNLHNLNILSSLSLGIIAGLFLGKQLGIFSAVLLCVKSGLTRLPTHTSYGMLYGMALLCGIGFTMSLFIGGLAFDREDIMTSVRASVMIGSVISGIAGYIILLFCTSRKI